MTELIDSGTAGEQPMTRRQLRERERMLAQQHAHDETSSGTADDAVPANAVPIEAVPTQAVPIELVVRIPSPTYSSGTESAGAEGGGVVDADTRDGGDDETLPANSHVPGDLGSWIVPDTDGHSVHTSSIVLPALPAPGNTHEVIDGTGAILVTGSMDAPPASGAPGAVSDRYDSAEIDRLIDAADGEGHVVFDAEPVSATRAVSNATSTSVLVPAPARSRISSPVVLASTGGVLLVAVGTLLYVAFGMGL